MFKRIFFGVGLPLGTLAGFLSLTAFGLLYIIDVQFVFSGYKFAGFLIPFVVMAFAMKKYRDSINGGELQLSEGFLVGAITAFWGAIVAGVGFWVITNFIPNMVPAALTEYQELLQINKEKLSDEEFANTMANLQKITANRLAWDLTFKPLQFLFFLNLGAALFFRRIINP